MVVNNAIANLTELGFTEYEAKAYVALLEKYPSTAYEIAMKAGIPTSKIYEIIARLAEKNIVIAVNEANKNQYVPLKPDEVLDIHKNRVDKVLSSLKDELKEIEKSKSVSYIWNFNDYNALIEKSKRLIETAVSTLLISAWPEEYKILEDGLLNAMRKKCKIAIIHFGKRDMCDDSMASHIFEHPIEDTIFSEKKGRGIVIVSDSKEALMGTIFHNNKVEGAWSENTGFVTLAEDYIKHDIYIMKIVKRFNNELISRFGDNYIKLRDVFSDEVNK